MSDTRTRVRPVQPFFAVRVVIKWSDGNSTERDYVRDSSHHVGRAAYEAFAVGDLIGLVSGGFVKPTDYTRQQGIRWITVEEISMATVIENRKYHHTSH